MSEIGGAGYGDRRRQIKCAGGSEREDGQALRWRWVVSDVRPNGSKYWRLKYGYSDKERLPAFGTFPEVSLAEARKRRNDARTLLREGRDRGVVKRAEKAAIRVSEANTFEAIAREWLETQKKKLSDSTFAKAEWTLELTGWALSIRR